jgi:hypothetical protein
LQLLTAIAESNRAGHDVTLRVAIDAASVGSWLQLLERDGLITRHGSSGNPLIRADGVMARRQWLAGLPGFAASRAAAPSADVLARADLVIQAIADPVARRVVELVPDGGIDVSNIWMYGWGGVASPKSCQMAIRRLEGAGLVTGGLSWMELHLEPLRALDDVLAGLLTPPH